MSSKYKKLEKLILLLWVYWGWAIWFHPQTVDAVKMGALGLAVVYGPEISSWILPRLSKLGLWPVPYLDVILKALAIGVLAVTVFHMKAGHWAFVGGLILAVIGHEFGHWIAARLSGIPVPLFSIGMDPPEHGITSLPGLRLKLPFKPWGTEFQITPYLLGGFVKINPDDEVFRQAAAWKRVAVLLGGVTMNGVMAVAIIFGAYAAIGKPEAIAQIATIASDGPAASSGVIIKGDHIIAVDGVPVSSSKQVNPLVRRHSDGTTVEVTTQRGTFRVVPVDGRIGVALIDQLLPPVATSAGEALQLSVSDVGSMYAQVFEGFKMLAGVVPAPEGTDVRMRSVVGITQAGGELFRHSLFSFLWLLAFLNVSLCIFNLLPIAYLDGGHLVFLAYEKAVGRQMPLPVRRGIEWVSLRFLAVVALLAFYNDFAFPILQR